VWGVNNVGWGESFFADIVERRTIDRWNQRLHEEGQFNPHQMTSNNPASVLKGNPLLMPSVFRFCYLKATAAETNAFLFQSTVPGQQFRFYWSGYSR
jgi:hypothetical protein